MLEILPFTLGPFQTNSYLVADPDTAEAVVIDPAWGGESIVDEARKRGWRIISIWLTHAHVDHLAGSAAVADATSPPPPVALHPADYPLWRNQGGAALFGFQIDPGPEPVVELVHGMVLHLGNHTLEVRHTPGHSPGHVVLYCLADQVVFCGDLIFQGSIGRSDLPGGDYETLIDSIRTQILPLPDGTRLLPGHGPETRVGIERVYNPFISHSPPSESRE